MAKKKVEFTGNTLTSQGLKIKGSSGLFEEVEAKALYTLSTTVTPVVKKKDVTKNADTK